MADVDGANGDDLRRPRHSRRLEHLGALAREDGDEPWWRDRIRAGLASYWVYQHLGNLSPDELADNEDYQRLLSTEGDTWPHLAELADRADREVDCNKGVRFSYRWDLGRSRLIMVDSRNGRILESGERMMIGEREFDWLEAKAEERPEALDHLMLASSVPWLMPPAIGDLEALNERAADRPGWRGRFGEKLRRAADFEHWPAFYKSFVRLAEMIARIANHPDGPATISVLSGDVHHSYAARAELDGVAPGGSTVHQLVCSPVHNYVPLFIKPVFMLGWTRPAAAVIRWWVRRRGVPSPPMTWTRRLRSAVREHDRDRADQWPRSAKCSSSSHARRRRWRRRAGSRSAEYARSVELLTDLVLGDRTAQRGHPAGDLAGDVLIGQADVGEHLTT